MQLTSQQDNVPHNIARTAQEWLNDHDKKNLRQHPGHQTALISIHIVKVWPRTNLMHEIPTLQPVQYYASVFYVLADLSKLQNFHYLPNL